MDTTDAVMDLAKRRGFLWPAYEVYGGLAGFYDYGPLGAAMKARFEALWRRTFLDCAVPMAEVSCPRVTPFDVLKASGHVDEFTDLVVRCKNGHPQRADHLVAAAGFTGNADSLAPSAIDAELKARRAKCPTCADTTWSDAAPLNLMFATEIGPGSGRTGYLRPETAQGIFTDFPHLLRFFRGKLPFGAIQVGGSNRNEISPRQGMLRLREFHMMEAEVFFLDTDEPFAPFAEFAKDALTLVPASGSATKTTLEKAVQQGTICNQALGYFIGLTRRFLLAAGVDEARLRFRQHEPDEMAHYANDCWDAEFRSERYGWVECVGIADRGCYDLEQHATAANSTDFFVPTPYDPPLAVEATRRLPVHKVLGRMFKAETQAVAAALSRPFDDLLAKTAGTQDPLIVQGPGTSGPGKAPITLEVDGRTVEVPPEGYIEEKGTWMITGRRTIPRVIEPSFGVDRIMYALWEHGYEATTKEGEPYTILHLSPAVAPVHVAVLPLTSDEKLVAEAQAIERSLRAAGFATDFDTSGNIGRRYARQDEVGTPYSVTVDPDSLKDGKATIRDRDTTKQVRVAFNEIAAHL